MTVHSAIGLPRSRFHRIVHYSCHFFFRSVSSYLSFIRVDIYIILSNTFFFYFFVVKLYLLSGSALSVFRVSSLPNRY